MKHIAILTLMATFVPSAIAHQLVPPPSPQAIKGGGRGVGDVLQAKLAEKRDLENEGMQAEAKGNISVAEGLYLSATRIFPEDPSSHLLLASLYDRRGNERAARLHYKAVAVKWKGTYSSLQSDPAILARLGDLSLKQGLERDARVAYALASRQGPDGQWHPRTEPRTSSTRALRSSAHAAAAWEMGTLGRREEALAQAKMAVEADPQSWSSSYFLGRAYRMIGRQEDSKRELDLAEALAPSLNRAKLKSLRQ